MSIILSSSKKELIVPETPSEEVEFFRGDIIIQQFQKSEYFYFLEEGEISFHIFLEEESELFEIGTSSEVQTPVGWSGFNPPHRNATTVKVSSRSARLKRWKISELLTEFDQQPDQGIPFFKWIGLKARHLMTSIHNEKFQEDKLYVYSYVNRKKEFQKNKI